MRHFVVIRIVLSAVIVLLLAGARSLACSSYAPEHAVISGGNYDWSVHGGVVFVMPRDVDKVAYMPRPDAHPAAWRATYASVTITQFGREFPMQGLNEAGLSGAVLNGPAEYPVTGAEGEISEMQWLQYQLDRFATVDEVAAHAGELGIQKISGTLHFFLCDSTGDCGVVEFLGGQVQVSHGQALKARALTNTGYAGSVDTFEQFLASGGDEAHAPAGYASTNRFIRAALFSTSGFMSVTQVLMGLRDLASPMLTQWQSVFEHQTATLHVKTAASPLVDILRADFATDCRQIARMRIISQGAIGDWEAYSPDYARQLLNTAARSATGFSPEVIDGILQYGSSTSQCPTQR